MSPSDPKSNLLSPAFFQVATILVGLAVGWAAIDGRTQSALITLEDHEARMRSLERDVLSGLARIELRLNQLEGKNP